MSITLVQYFVNFLRPYAELVEFEKCVQKAVEQLKSKRCELNLDTACDT